MEKKGTKGSCWSPPSRDFLKMNFDGALSTSKQKTGLRVVIRDLIGHAVICRAKQRHLCSPLMAECESALLGLQMATTLGIKKLEVEGDSMKVI